MNFRDDPEFVIERLERRVTELEAALRPLAEGLLGSDLRCTYCAQGAQSPGYHVEHAPTCPVLAARALLGVEEGRS